VDPDLTGPLVGSGYKMLFRSGSKSQSFLLSKFLDHFVIRSGEIGRPLCKFSQEKFFNSLSFAFFYLKSRTRIQRYIIPDTKHTTGYEKFLPVDQDVRHLIQLVQNLKNSQLLISLHIHSFRFVWV
jgi:hypothetical protein